MNIWESGETKARELLTKEKARMPCGSETACTQIKRYWTSGWLRSVGSVNKGKKKGVAFNANFNYNLKYLNRSVLKIERGWRKMGKDLKGRELGTGIRQRKDGRYEARAVVQGVETVSTGYN